MNDLNARFARFRACCDDAPAGTYEAEREMRQVIGDAVDSLMRVARAHWGLIPCNSDGAHNVEATIYAWLTEGGMFGATAEGFGDAMGTPASDRVLSQSTRDRDAPAAIRGRTDA